MTPRKKKETPTHPPQTDVTQVAPDTSTPPPYVFNFKTVKDMAKPGSWRRGYGYYRKPGQVLAVEPSETGVLGKVKGNYQDSYEINLAFAPERVSATCTCPLEEEWCKHVVSVALNAIDKHIYEDFYKLPYFVPAACPTLEDAPQEAGYRFGLQWDVKPKFLTVAVDDGRTGEAVASLEPILKAALAAQQSGALELEPGEKADLKVIQALYKYGEADPETPGTYHVGVKSVAQVLEKLTQVYWLCNDADATRIAISADPLNLVLSVNASLVGNVLVSLHWHYRGVPASVFPLEEIQMFGREVPWGYRQGILYPLANTFRNLSNALTRGTFYDIRDADGGKFVFDELPQIRHHVEVEQAQIIDKATLAQEPPIKVVQMKRLDQTTLRTELFFDYDGTLWPYSKGNDAPFVTVVEKDKDSIYWLKRDKKGEDRAFQALTKTHLEPLQTNHFAAEGDDAIDFYNIDREQLASEGVWRFDAGDDNFDDLKLSPDPLRIIARIDFDEDSVDAFTMAIACGIGPETIDLDTVQGFFTQGRKYIHIEGKGWVEIPLATILQFTKTLNSFDKDYVDRDIYRIKTYQAGLVSELADQGVDLQMAPRFQEFWDRVTGFNHLESVEVPENVRAELRPYQKQGFNWLWFLYDYGLNGILADDMGLGKTLQTLVTLQKAKNNDGRQPSLIVCPTSVVYNWLREAERFTPELACLNLTGPDRHVALKKIPETDLIITSYALLRRDIEILKQFPFRYVILDESQNIKNVESQTAQASKRLEAKHRLALSGTPIENNLSEVWSAFDFLMPGFLLDLDEFRYRYVAPIEEKGNRDAERRLKKQLSPFILRRLKRDVAKDLPEKIEQVAYCEMLPEQRELYMEILEKTKAEVFAQYNAQGQAVSQASVLAALLRLRQACCHPDLLKDSFAHEGVGSGKFEAMTELIGEIIGEGHRILLFSQFVEMLDIVKAYLERKGIRYEYLTGSTKDRQERVDRFNKDEKIPIFLISLKAGGTGLNLTGADYVIHYDPWWNPAAEAQATDRAHRIGQTRTVMVYRLITRGSVEEKILRLQERKKNLVDAVIGIDREIGKKFSFEDLKDILTPDF